MNYIRILQIAIIGLCLLCNLSATAETKPRWVKKGVKELNNKRSNDNYSFHMFHSIDADKKVFEWNPFKPLLDYVDSTYKVPSAQLFVDSIPSNGTLPTTYRVSFDKAGQPHAVYAQLVDEYMKFDDYADNSYEYNLYQLYAISDEDAGANVFDQFTLKRKYGALPVVMSIIPGLGQIYKGQTAKGYTFLGTEVVMIAGIIYSTTQVHRWMDQAHKYPVFYANYRSKAKTARQFRAFCAIAGGGLYIYNLFDAAFSKGARYVEVKRRNQTDAQMTFMPVIDPDMMGLGVNITF